MMEYPLTISFILRRAETLFGHKAIVTRRPDKTIHRYTYADFVPRAKKLAVALQQLGLQRGDRVATLCWNQYEHLEAYFGIPLAGNVLHTINPRLHPSDLAYIVNDAEDRVLIIDDTLLPLLEKFRADVRIEHIVVIEHGAQAPAGTIGYEKLLAGADASAFVYPELDEREAAAMCYTSGTTGRPKGVVYSHRALVLHSLGQASGAVGVLHAWGMTETTPLGVVSSLMSDLEDADVETRFGYRAKQGYPVPLVEIRARNDAGHEVPWDGKTMGELEVRGPWVARAYYKSPESADRFTPDGWFRTGDVVTIDARGYVEIQDRSKDLIKSGGEWISSVALENALMGHPAVAEAAVIAVPHTRC